MGTSVATFELFPTKLWESVRAVILFPSLFVVLELLYSEILERRGVSGFRAEWLSKRKSRRRLARAIGQSANCS
jgi:hypothetical protein